MNSLLVNREEIILDFVFPLSESNPLSDVKKFQVKEVKLYGGTKSKQCKINALSAILWESETFTPVEVDLAEIDRLIKCKINQSKIWE